MALKKTRIAVVLIMAITVLVLFAILFIPSRKTETFVASNYRYPLDYFNELDDIPIFSQETGYTCYIVSMAIVKNYLGFETTEHQLRNDLDLLERSKGMLPNEYLVYAKKVFAPLSFSVSLVNPISQAEILNLISDSLENDLPVVIFYSAKDDWNKPHYNTHYAMVYGIDMKKGLVKISNPYGYLEELSFEELYNGLDFTSYEAEPLLFWLGRKIGRVSKNNIFVFEKIS